MMLSCELQDRYIITMELIYDLAALSLWLWGCTKLITVTVVPLEFSISCNNLDMSIKGNGNGFENNAVSIVHHQEI